MRSEGYGSRSVCVCACVFVCPGRSSATHATKRQTTDLVSCWLQNDLVLLTVVGHFYTRNGLIFRIPSVYYARDFTRAVNLYAHV